MRGNNLPASPFLEARAKDFDLVSILRMTDEYYENVIGPILYTHITPAERVVFRRNAAVALGNLGDPAAVPALCEALDDPAEVLRAHAAWALGRIGGSVARSALETRRKSETGMEARREIEEALAGMVN
jgi:epoxyqueuosine reductase